MDVVSQDVYLGTDYSSVLNATPASQEHLVSTPDNYSFARGLPAGTEHFWRVDTTTSAGTLIGTVWRFTTSNNIVPVILNGEFELGEDIFTVDNWYDSSSTDIYYSPGSDTYYPAAYGRVASIKAAGNLYIQQLIGIMPEYDINFNFGYRNDAATNGSITLRVSLWDTINNIELAGQNFVKTPPAVVPMTDPDWGAFTGERATLSIDISAFTGFERLALRFTNLSNISSPWQATALIDNVATVGSCPEYPRYDFTGPDGHPDCKVDIYELVALMSHWLDCGIVPACE